MYNLKFIIYNVEKLVLIKLISLTIFISNTIVSFLSLGNSLINGELRMENSQLINKKIVIQSRFFILL